MVVFFGVFGRNSVWVKMAVPDLGFFFGGAVHSTVYQLALLTKTCWIQGDMAGSLDRGDVFLIR